MALQGPFVVVADSPTPHVVEALRAAGAFPIIETTWADAAAAMASVEPEAVVLAEPCGDGERADEFARALNDRIEAGNGAFMPVIALTRDDGAALMGDTLAIRPTCRRRGSCTGSRPRCASAHCTARSCAAWRR